jgi:hypothetical protein
MPMIDYFAHTAVFERVRTELAGVADPGLAGARDKLLADAAAYPEAALLGTFVDHLLMHADNSGAEIEILGRAADLWESGRSVFDAAGSVKAAVEAAFANPTAPNAAASFNAAMATLIGLRAKLAVIQAGMDALGNDVTQWRHLPDPHPRQRDITISRWDWGDRFLARRTEAFVRATFKNAKDPRTSAFALGALASYAGNVGGSAYLGHVVGGPRRTHPRRDRIARNAVGAWIRANRTLPNLQALEAGIHRNGSAGHASALRSDLDSFLQQSLNEAFPGMPRANLSVGLARLEKHLALLAIFVRPPLPVPPSPILMATMASLSADGSVDISQPDPADLPPYGPPPPPGPDPTPTDPPRTTDESSAEGCWVAALVVTALYLLIDGIVDLAEGKKYDPIGDLSNVNTGSASDDENVTATSQQLVALSSSSGGTLMVAELFSFQMKVWQAMDDALTILVKKGLVYPDELIIGGITFSQFTAVGPLSPWPLRTEVAADEGYLDFPSGPVEHPSAAASPFPVGATPFTFVDVPSAPTSFQSAPIEAVRLWLQIAREQQDPINYDLDADRGHHAPCWQVAEKMSINDDPVIVDVLPYTGL